MPDKEDNDTRKIQRPLEPAEIDKLNAETEKIKTETEQVKASVDEANLRAQAAELKLSTERFMFEREQEKRQRELTSFNRQHIYYFSSHVDEESCARCIRELNYWSQSDPKCDIEIVFNSPGGGAFSGMSLFDYIQDLRKKGHSVTTATRGMAASMGGILLQAGDKRVMSSEAYVLIHEISTMAIGKVADIEDEVALAKMMTRRIVDIFVSRAKGKISKAKLEKGMTRKDWWLSSDECLKYGLVDEVR